MSDHEVPTAPKPMPSHPTSRPMPKTATPGISIFAVIICVLFLGAIAFSVYAERVYKPAPAAAPADPAAPAEAAKAADPATPAPAPAAATAADVKGLKGEMAALAAKLDAMPKAEPAADLKPIHDKVDALAKTVATVAEAPKKVTDEVAGKLSEAEKADATMKSEIDALKAEVAGLKEAMKAKPVTPAADTPKPAAGVDAAAMTAALDLFKANKIPDALAAFKKLPADDARVLYYTALATGLSTNNWKGDTEATVMKGVDREKAGTPAKADIDAAMAGLTKEQKAWLDAYRAKAK
jgi:hypothetical protein